MIQCLHGSEGRVSSSGARTSLAAKQILASHRAHRQDGDRQSYAGCPMDAACDGDRGQADVVTRKARAAILWMRAAAGQGQTGTGQQTTISNGSSCVAVCGDPDRGRFMTKERARSTLHAICETSRQWAMCIRTISSEHCTPEFAAGRRDAPTGC